jgi:hypothetical protein
MSCASFACCCARSAPAARYLPLGRRFIGGRLATGFWREGGQTDPSRAVAWLCSRAQPGRRHLESSHAWGTRECVSSRSCGVDLRGATDERTAAAAACGDPRRLRSRRLPSFVPTCSFGNERCSSCRSRRMGKRLCSALLAQRPKSQSPLTLRISPVMNPASGAARQSTAEAISIA